MQRALGAIVAIIAFQYAALVTAQSDPREAVFQVEAWQKSPEGVYRSVGPGTGFFVSADGTALTNSHMVYKVVHDPEHFRLMAIVGKEFYDATVVCASRLPYDPTKTDSNHVGIALSKDVAQIRLSPASFPFRQVIRRIGGEVLVRAEAHRDPLPEFPFLVIGGNPQGHVRIMGYGHLGPIPQQWESSGQVVRTYRAQDGTEIFDIDSGSSASGRPQPGNSGSPVLNDQNQVVGIWTWFSYTPPSMASCHRGTANTGASVNVAKRALPTLPRTSVTPFCDPTNTANPLMIKSIQKSRFAQRRYFTSAVMTPMRAKGYNMIILSTSSLPRGKKTGRTSMSARHARTTNRTMSPRSLIPPRCLSI